MKQQLHQIIGRGTGVFYKCIVARKATVDGDDVQVGIKLMKIAEGVNSDSRTGYGIIERCRLLQISAQHLPDASAQLCQQLAVEQKIDPYSFGNAYKPLALVEGTDLSTCSHRLSKGAPGTRGNKVSACQ